jgi:hypothetical protein
MSTVKWDTILPVNIINFTNLNVSFITGYQFPKRTCEILKSGSRIISANRSIFRTLAQEVVSMLPTPTHLSYLALSLLQLLNPLCLAYHLSPSFNTKYYLN